MRRSRLGLGTPFISSVAVFGVSLCVYVWAFSRMSGVSDALPVRLMAAAAVAAMVWLSAFGVTHSKGAATFAWAAVCLSAPFLLNSQYFVPGAFVDVFYTLGSLRTARLGSLAAGAPGVLFDQEFGLFAYAPVLLLGFVGLGALALDRSRRAVAIALSCRQRWHSSPSPDRWIPGGAIR